MSEMFEADRWVGSIKKFPYFDTYPWLEQFKDQDICVGANTAWANFGDLPLEYSTYILIHHVEICDIHWLEKQQKRVDAPIYVLMSGSNYGIDIPGVTFISYTHWHDDLNKLIAWWGVRKIPQTKKYKFSTVCNRVTQSKVWVTAKLLETARDTSLIINNPGWIEDKNVHGWQHTGIEYLDTLTDIYRDKYINLYLTDSFDKTKNFQRYNSNPWQPMYEDAAIHFTNGSHHYSLMDGYTYPGPHVDEKTFKCLVAGIPFIPTAQFDIYGQLSKLGLEFEYHFDTSWDQDPGNLSRFVSICKLIDELNEYSADELYRLNRAVAEYNQAFIIGGQFEYKCEEHNQHAIAQLEQLLG